MNIGYLLGIDLDLPIWLILLTALFITYYIYMTWENGVFKKLGIPGPSPLPLLGNAYHFFKGGFIGLDNYAVAKYGDLVGIFQGRQPILLIRDPEIIKEVLVKQFNNFVNRQNPKTVFNDDIADNMLTVTHNEIWRNLRNTMSPTFSAGKMKKMMQHMTVTSDQLVNNLEDAAAKGNTIEFSSFTKSFAMDMIAGTAFGIQLDSQRDKESQFVKMAHKGFDLKFDGPVFIFLTLFPFFFPLLTKLGLKIFPDREAASFFTKVTEQIMADRQKNPKEHADFIQLVMNAHKDEEISEDNDERNKTAGKKRALTKKEIIANSVLFFLAGYETTSNTLSFAVHLLAVNPECQEKLYQQIDEILQGQEPTYDKLHDVPYLDQVLDETLRLYPQAPRLDRNASEAVTIKGVEIPKGMQIGIPIHSLHYDANIWPDPQKFDPDRFTPENKASRNPYIYLPFGMGPRNCIGMRLAQMEIKIALIKLLQNYKFTQAPETQFPLKTQKIRMCSEKGVFLKIQPRVKTEE